MERAHQQQRSSNSFAQCNGGNMHGAGEVRSTIARSTVVLPQTYTTQVKTLSIWGCLGGTLDSP